MQVLVSGKQVQVADPLRAHVKNRLEQSVEKYFANAIDAHVAFSRDGQQIRADCQVHVGHGINVQCHASADSIHPCLEAVMDRLEKRLRRYKRRLRDHHSRRTQVAEPPTLAAQSYVLAPEPEDESLPESDQPVIVAETTTRIHQLSVGEAVMRMDLADLPLLLFRESGHGRLNVVYRRKDGHIGWIDPGPDGAGA